MPSETILIVEDDPVGRQVLQKALRTAGYEVAVAPDAVGALSQARSRRPALIVLDLGLPAGGGLTVLNRLRNFPELAVTPVLVVSGQDRATSEQPALAAGATEFIAKPAATEQIVSAIRRILDDGGGSPAT